MGNKHSVLDLVNKMWPRAAALICFVITVWNLFEESVCLQNTCQHKMYVYETSKIVHKHNMVFLTPYKWTHGRAHRWANRQNVMGVKMEGGRRTQKKEDRSFDCLWHVISEEEKKLSKLLWSEEWGRKIRTGSALGSTRLAWLMWCWQ